MYRPQGLRLRLLSLLDARPLVTLPPDTAAAAVLVPIVAADDEARLIFTKRSDTLSRHAGEISFPGGLAEPREDMAAAALRETEEELGLPPSAVEVLGALPPVHTRVTGILIVPFVGYLTQDPRFTPNVAEIADILEFSVADLASVQAQREFQHEGRSFQTFVYELAGNLIWGATARILSSLIGLLGENGPTAPRREGV